MIPTPASVPATYSLAQRSALVHQILAVVAFLALLASTVPALAAYQHVIITVCALLGFGTFAACKAYMTPRVRAIVEQWSPTPVEPIVSGMAAVVVPFSVAPLALLVLTLGSALFACGHVRPLPTPDPVAYVAAFKACLVNEGVLRSGPEANKIWLILDQGGNSAQEIEAKIEQVALTVTADTAIVCIDCAIVAWQTNNPIPPGKPITPSQGAARLYAARHLASPTLRRAATLRP